MIVARIIRTCKMRTLAHCQSSRGSASFWCCTGYDYHNNGFVSCIIISSRILAAPPAPGESPCLFRPQDLTRISVFLTIYDFSRLLSRCGLTWDPNHM